MLTQLQQESDSPFWKLPPPLGYEFPELPAEDPNRTISVAQYNKRLKTAPEDFGKLNDVDVTLRRVILNEIENLPELWTSDNMGVRRKMYPVVGCAVYRRTGVLLTTIYKSARISLRRRLLRAIVHLNLNGMELEEHLWRSGKYSSIRFYRNCTQAWEQKTREMISKTTSVVIQSDDDNGDETMDFVDDTSSVNEDIHISDVSETQTGPHQTNMSSSHQSVVKNEISEVYEPEPLMESSNERKPILQISTQGVNKTKVEPNQREMHSFNQAEMRSDYGQMEERKPIIEPYENHGRGFTSPTENQGRKGHQSSFNQERALFIQTPNNENALTVNSLDEREATNGNSDGSEAFQADMAYISHQMNKIIQEQPNRKKLLRDVLVQTLLAFDRNKNNDSSKIFKELTRIFDN